MTDDSEYVSRRKYLAWASAATGGAMALAGCTGGQDQGSSNQSQGGRNNQSTGSSNQSGDGSSNNSELELQHWWTAGGDGEAMTALLDRFKEKNPNIKVTENPVGGAGGQNLHNVIQNRVLNNNPPSTWQDWPGENLQPYAQADKLKDIGDIWTEKKRNAYLDGPKLQARAGDSENPFYAVPLNIHRINNLFYNVELVEEAGVDPTSFGNPQDLIDAMDTIESETDAAGMGQETSSAQGTLQLFSVTLLGEAGVDTFQQFIGGNTDGIEDAVTSALETVKSYSEYYTQDAGSINQDEAGYKVANGEAAFMNQGDWQAGNFETIDGFDYESGWRHVPWPGTKGYYQLNMDGFPFPKNNPSPNATRKFLEFVGTVEAQEIFNPLKGSIPPRSDVPKEDFGPFLKKQIEQFNNSEAQPPSIAHGLALPPDTLNNLTEGMANFISGYNIQKAQQNIIDIVSE
ncbi:ABC transporter substrate-binding protein [Halococcus agarilyticus]|uniref:ABC transporter substrate-binding protein n=1 Tax=Halococcus agarilyticus TaxID=1232219 RepID=UPI0009AF0E37|nr:ABC transporter substrate-binding protein [Halococcus agarilyticus]